MTAAAMSISLWKGTKQSSARRALFGSVSQKIIKSVRCPVITVREGVYE